MVKQLRPRLTEQEIQFLIHVLKHMFEVLDQREQQFKQLELEVYRLRQEVLKGNTMVWRELRDAKAKLKELGNFEGTLFHYRTAINGMIRRYESLLNGKYLHLSWVVRYSLKQILEPKSL